MNFLASRDVTARSIRTRIVEGGSGPPVLFIHGMFSNHHAFDDVMEKLYPHFHVVAVDLPGFGQSEAPSPSRFSYQAESYAEVMVDIIAALQLGRSHVVGHAFGASVALALSVIHPELVHHLCLVSPEVFRSSTPPIERLWLTPIIGPLFFKQFFSRKIFRSYLSKYLYAPGHNISESRFDEYFMSFRPPEKKESALSVLRNQQDRRPEIARLTRVKSPTLIIAGRSDPNLTTNLVQRIVRQIENARVEFVDAGHSPQEEQPDIVAKSLMSFFPEPSHDSA